MTPFRTCAAFAAALAIPVVSFAGPAHVFTGVFDALNDSGVTGTARLTLKDNTLRVQIDASGLEANQSHAQHIHGLLDGGFAECPTLQQDTNHDGFISVIEGAAPYGPIKVNLTSPPTSFGTPPNPLLFAPFAGTPNSADFPTAPDGSVHYDQTIVFDLSKSDDAAAFDAINPLTKQHIVLHGMMAPESVDADALGITDPDPAKIIYDPLLPIACTELTAEGSAAVPLPPAAYSGLMTLAALGGGLMLRKRRATE